MSDADYEKYYCHNPKCRRMLLPFKGAWVSYPKMKHGFMILSSMNSFVASDRFILTLKEFAPDDFTYTKLTDNTNLLEVTSTYSINECYLSDDPPCPDCHYPISVTCGEAVTKDGLLLFKEADNKNSKLCRTKITAKDSSRANYQLFADEQLAKALKQFKCFSNMLKCI